jgi:hypothetical protein
MTLLSVKCRSWLVSVTEQRATTTSSTASLTDTVKGVPFSGFRNLIYRRGTGPSQGLYLHWTTLTQQNKKFWEALIGSGKLLLAFANKVILGSGSGGTHYHIFLFHDSGSRETASYGNN